MLIVTNVRTVIATSLGTRVEGLSLAVEKFARKLVELLFMMIIFRFLSGIAPDFFLSTETASDQMFIFWCLF